MWPNSTFSSPPRKVMFSSLFVCMSVCLLATAQKLPNGIAWNFQGRLVMTKFWWRSGSPSGYRDCFPDSSLVGDTESGINRLRYVTLQCRACTSGHHHSNCDVITSPAYDRQPRQTCLGGGKHCSICPTSCSSVYFCEWKVVFSFRNYWKCCLLLAQHNCNAVIVIRYAVGSRYNYRIYWLETVVVSNKLWRKLSWLCFTGLWSIECKNH